jgi:hypothetical protein
LQASTDSKQAVFVKVRRERTDGTRLGKAFSFEKAGYFFGIEFALNRFEDDLLCGFRTVNTVMNKKKKKTKGADNLLKVEGGIITVKLKHTK